MPPGLLERQDGFLPPATALILGSASPRRLDLLAQIGVTPSAVDPADIDESVLPDETAANHAKRLSLTKAQTVAVRRAGCFVLAGDTVVACGRRILPKAEQLTEARACLSLLSGRRHMVHGAVTLIHPDGRIAHRYVQTAVVFKRLAPSEIESYLQSGEWQGKAGGYAIQGLASRYIRQIIGSYSNVVGLPLFETTQLLNGAGFFSSAR